MPDQISVTVESTVFHNEENGYTVLQVRKGRRSLTAVGTLPPLANGEMVDLEGEMTEHPRYGKQFRVTRCTIRQPSTRAGIESFLASGLIKGVGPSTAHLLVKTFGDKTMEVLASSPDKVAAIKGIGKKKAGMICQSFAEQYAVREAMVYLQSYGIAPSLAVRISRQYGQSVQSVMQTNPYRMVDDIDGIGFTTADRIASVMGISPDSDFRLQSGIKFVLSEAAGNDGHTYLPEEVLIPRASAMLRVNRELLQDNLQQMILNKDVILSQLDGSRVIFLPRMYYAELETAQRLMLLLRRQDGEQIQGELSGVTDKDISEFEKSARITFSPNQRRAVRESVTRPVTVITGGPGTGKTTIINCIISLLRGQALLAAPTGRAAKRMSEATGREAKTLHRLLEYGGEENTFQRDQDNPLKTKCVIVDEMSMVDIFLMRALLRALRPGTRLILVGDADQLPSVGAGNVLGDILASGCVPSVCLTDIFRQSGQSMIVANAHRVNHGEMPLMNQKGSDFFYNACASVPEAAQCVVGLCRDRLPRFLGTDAPVRDIQVLCPTRKGDCGVTALNQMLQQALNPPAPDKAEVTYGDNIYRQGDKVMHIRNDYDLAWESVNGEDGEGVFNGDIGYITEVSTEEHTVTVCYDDERIVEYDYTLLEELDLAYALSVHKSQGSEFPCVVMPAVGGPRMLLTRNLFYTALTRARKLVVLAGFEDAIAQMVQNDHIAKRYTALRQRMEDLNN